MTAAIAEAPKRWAREYETIYILKPNTSPEDAAKVASRVGEVMEKMGAKLTKVDNWGKRKLAYSIAKFTRGIFIYVKYVAYADVVAELERNLRNLDAVMRYQTIVVEDLIDLDTVNVDPAETEFAQIEMSEEEEEPRIEERLGLIPSRSQQQSRYNDHDSDMGGYDGSDEEEE